MKNLLNTLIDYLLFEKYDKQYFCDNLIVPIKEDEIYLTFAVCKNSNLKSVKSDFKKLLKFQEYEELDIRFILNHVYRKIEIFTYANEALLSNDSSKSNMESFLYELLRFSIEARASDIHVEIYKELLFFKFRVDGRLKNFFIFKKSFFSMFSSYIKLVSNLDITQTRLPMDSRFSIDINDKKYDFRLSTMPSSNGESIVIRVLDNKNISKPLKDLGFSFDNFNKLQDALKLTQGLILITGPTGSGKTTTLYSILKQINSEEKKIITIEDPIEYKIESITQVAVNTKVGLSFELILKNILRQDPDIIFIGEIRDKFSLNIALQASLTGHLVLASIHANNSLETVNRLFDLDADPFLVSVTLKYVLAQRLIKTYCKNCSARGCSICNFSKFYGRCAISEVLKIDETLSSMIFKKCDINEIKKHMAKMNFKTLKDDALLKVESNESSLEEIYKVINE